MALNKSTEFAKSRYVHGGTTDVYPTRLGWWSRRTLTKSDDDIYITINARYNKRAWMVADDYYGQHNLEWLILQYNNILDPNEEFVTGVTIRIPTPQRMGLEIVVGKLGGNTVSE